MAKVSSVCPPENSQPVMCLLVKLMDRHRFVGASSGTQQQVNRHVEEAMVVYRQEASTRLAHEMPPHEMTMTLDETLTGGLCLVGMDPESTDIVLEHTAPARDHDTWDALMAPALAGLNCKGMQATSDEAPGLLAYVAHHLGAHHSPDLFHGQPALHKAVSALLALKQRAVAQTMTQAKELLTRLQDQLPTPTTSQQ